jgi:hypothetical protein
LADPIISEKYILAVILQLHWQPFVSFLWLRVTYLFSFLTEWAIWIVFSSCAWWIAYKCIKENINRSQVNSST